MELVAPSWGITIPVGKDSMSMKTRWSVRVKTVRYLAHVR